MAAIVFGIRATGHVRNPFFVWYLFNRTEMRLPWLKNGKNRPD
jgi:hypothetical protein